MRCAGSGDAAAFVGVRAVCPHQESRRTPPQAEFMNV
jgi:hypothetical protein